MKHKTYMVSTGIWIDLPVGLEKEAQKEICIQKFLEFLQGDKSKVDFEFYSSEDEAEKRRLEDEQWLEEKLKLIE